MCQCFFFRLIRANTVPPIAAIAAAATAAMTAGLLSDGFSDGSVVAGESVPEVTGSVGGTVVSGGVVSGFVVVPGVIMTFLFEEGTPGFAVTASVTFISMSLKVTPDFAPKKPKSSPGASYIRLTSVFSPLI